MPLPATRIAHIVAIIPAPQKAASRSRFGCMKRGGRSGQLENQERTKGETMRVAMAVLPHQATKGLVKERLVPESTWPEALISAARKGVKIPAKKEEPHVFAQSGDGGTFGDEGSAPAKRRERPRLYWRG